MLYSNLAAERSTESPGVRRKRAYPRTVIVLFLMCLAVMAEKRQRKAEERAMADVAHLLDW